MIENYIMGTYGVEACGDGDNDEKRIVSNKWSQFDGKTLYCFDGILVEKTTLEHFNPDVEYGKIIDKRNRKLYRTVAIGGNTWMAENLNLDYKVNGSTYGTYTNTDNGEIYGHYYTWAAAMDSAGVYSENSKGCGYNKTCTVKTPARGICPEGWHIPTSAEWSALYSAIGSSPYAMQAKGFDKWPDATDAYGFSALPAGFYYSGSFTNVGSYAYFWGAAEGNSTNAYLWGLNASIASLDDGYEGIGNSVRCLKD